MFSFESLEANVMFLSLFAGSDLIVITRSCLMLTCVVLLKLWSRVVLVAPLCSSSELGSNVIRKEENNWAEM